MSIAALVVIVFLIIGLAAAIVYLGSLPGKLAIKHNHPYPDAVNAASWIGLATGVLWPFAFVWAFLPYPVAAGGSAATGTSGPTSPNDVAELQKRLASLEATIAELQSNAKEGA